MRDAIDESWRPKFAGAFCTAIGSALLYGLGVWIAFRAIGNGAVFLLTLTFLVCTPVVAANIAVRIADPARRGRKRDHALLGAIVVTAMLLVGFFFLEEGGACVVMSAPLFFPAGIASAVITGMDGGNAHQRLNVAVLPALPFLLLPIENAVGYPLKERSVMDQIDLRASPERVWSNLTEVRNIRPSELGWTFTQDMLGIPKPVDARLDRQGVGAIRDVRWGAGVHFGEKITNWQRARSLNWTFEFTKNSLPPWIDRNLSVNADYLKVTRGGYRLSRLSGGGTRLTLTTYYQLRTPLNDYCAWWGHIMIGDFHRNVLRVIRSRSEQNL